MELSRKLSQQLVFYKKPQIDENLLIVTDKSTPEEKESQPLQTDIE